LLKSRWIYVVFLTIILAIEVPISEAQTQPSINLQGLTWSHSTITVLVIPESDELWWDQSYLNATLRAMNVWNNAIMNFSYYSSQFSYLSQIRMVYSISSTLELGYNIYITWQEEYLGTNTLGTSQSIYEPPCIIINNTISLGSKTKGYALNEIDMQNIAVHELGHALGLAHSDYSGDIMYPEYTPKGKVLALSTLDIYAVSIVFEWLSHYPQPKNKCPLESSITLPLDIQYEYLPILYSDLPPPSPPASPLRILLEFIFGLIYSNIVIVFMLLLIISLMILLIAIIRVKGTEKVPTIFILIRENTGQR